MYSWRVPLTLGNADLTITSSQELGELGGGKGEPVVLPWRWYYHLPSLALFWGLLAIPLLAKENRRWSAWAVLLPLAPVVVLAALAVENLSPAAGSGLDFFRFFLPFWMALIVLRPMQRAFSERLPMLACISAVLIPSVLALMCWMNHRGLAGSADDLLVFVWCTVGLFALLLPITICVRFRHRPSSAERSTAWPLVWTALTAAVVALVIVAW